LHEVLQFAEQHGLNVSHYTTSQMSWIETAMRRLGIPVLGLARSLMEGWQDAYFRVLL